MMSWQGHCWQAQVRSSRLLALGGAPLEGESVMRLVYVDEAGRSGNEPVVVVAAVIVHGDSQLIPLEKDLDLLVEKWIPEEFRDDFVFHAAHIFNGTGKGVFSRREQQWPPERRSR